MSAQPNAVTSRDAGADVVIVVLHLRVDHPDWIGSGTLGS